MNKTILTLLVLGWSVIPLKAQNAFTFEPEVTVIHDTLGNVAAFWVTITNDTQSDLSIGISRTINNLPTGWISLLCNDVVCIGNVDYVEISGDYWSTPLSAGESRYFLLLDVVTDSNEGTGIVQIVVFNLAEPTDTDTVNFITSTNFPPVANAGNDQEVNEGEYVYLDGMDSFDPDGDDDDLLFNWTAPEGIVLSNATDIDPYFIAPDVAGDTNYLFTLTVKDGEFDSEPDTVFVNVKDITVDIVEDIKLPKIYSLYQNYPNPFNPITTISYEIPYYTKVNISIFDLIGNKVRTIVNDIYHPGRYKVRWDGTDDSGQMVSGGIYLYSIRAGMFAQTRKLVFLK